MLCNCQYFCSSHCINHRSNCVNVSWCNCLLVKNRFSEKKNNLSIGIFSSYVVSYIYPMTWSFYTVSVLLGFGAAFIWNGQGVYLSINSDDSTISRNTGIFWAFYQSRYLFYILHFCCMSIFFVRSLVFFQGISTYI